MFLYILTYLYVYVTYIRTYLHTFLYTCRKESTSKLFLPRLHATRALHLSHLHWQDFWGSGNWNAEMESHWKLKIAHSTIKKLSFLPVRGLKNTPLQRNGIFLPECFGRTKHVRWNTPPSEVFLEDHRQDQDPENLEGDWHVWLRKKLVPITTQTCIYKLQSKKVLAFLFQPASTFEKKYR